jgi:hypothetical protein
MGVLHHLRPRFTDVRAARILVGCLATQVVVDEPREEGRSHRAMTRATNSSPALRVRLVSFSPARERARPPTVLDGHRAESTACRRDCVAPRRPTPPGYPVHRDRLASDSA